MLSPRQDGPLRLTLVVKVTDSTVDGLRLRHEQALE